MARRRTERVAPKAQGIWRDDEHGGALVRDEPVVVHCYTTPEDIQDDGNLAELGRFCRAMGRESHQGEIGLVVGDEYFAIQDFEKEMTTRLDMHKIAKGLHAERRGKVVASGGYFGATQLAADVEARFRVPAGGGRATDPRWTERRLVPLAPRTLRRLDELTAELREHSGVRVEPMQLAALLLEKTTERLSADEAEELVQTRP